MTERSPGENSVHDILAAEAFAVPAPDPGLRHDLVLPEDPAGIAVAHDILAAEEFAMPAPEPGSMTDRMRAAAPGRSRWMAILGLALLAYWIVRSRLR
jgi:hypothetical protein